MRALHKLSSLKIKNLPPGKYSDGGGLWLHLRKDGGAQWFLRLTIGARRREMGLGSVNDVSLKEAREAAQRYRRWARAGRDPIVERDRLKREAGARRSTLAEVAAEAFDARKAELKDGGKAGRWFSPLELHVLPKLGRLPVSDIDQRSIRDVMQPIWHEKADTARKAMNRLNIVMRHAAALGLEVDLQAVDKAKALLGKSRHEPTHIPAMPWQEVPAFYASLSEGTITHLALRLLILTALRSAPVRFCRLDQISGSIWTVPAEIMKGRRGQVRDFRVPLSREALAVIDASKPFERDGYIFHNARKGVISDATMARHMERRGLESRPHGFRTSFRTWCAEATETPPDIAEMALGHAVGSQVERAYRRTDLLEKRSALMERWASFVVEGGGDVISLGGARRLESDGRG